MCIDIIKSIEDIIAVHCQDPFVAGDSFWLGGLPESGWQQALVGHEGDTLRGVSLDTLEPLLK